LLLLLLLVFCIAKVAEKVFSSHLNAASTYGSQAGAFASAGAAAEQVTQQPIELRSHIKQSAISRRNQQ
jgi:hypothetical protein